VACTSAVDSHTSTPDTRKCSDTVLHDRFVSTVSPPMSACATIPTGITAASTVSRRRRGRWPERGQQHQAAIAMSTKVSSRLPNSTHWCSGAISAWLTGTMLPGKHSGKVGQPSPDPVTRTVAPVTMIPTCATRLATASRRRVVGETSGSRSSRATPRW
jgi:hypothetical protein